MIFQLGLIFIVSAVVVRFILGLLTAGSRGHRGSGGGHQGQGTGGGAGAAPNSPNHPNAQPARQHKSRQRRKEHRHDNRDSAPSPVVPHDGFRDDEEENRFAEHCRFSGYVYDRHSQTVRLAPYDGPSGFGGFVGFCQMCILIGVLLFLFTLLPQG